ncbi:hypothetical protein ACFX15_018541 [Malus domestica]
MLISDVRQRADPIYGFGSLRRLVMLLSILVRCGDSGSPWVSERTMIMLSRITVDRRLVGGVGGLDAGEENGHEHWVYIEIDGCSDRRPLRR